MSAEQKMQEAGWDVNRAISELDMVRRYYGLRESEVPRALAIAITNLETAVLWIKQAKALADEENYE